jgi:tetratricopeptide (TPR) repeat protein
MPEIKETQGQQNQLNPAEKSALALEYFNSGIACQNKGRLTQAMEFFKKVIALEDFLVPESYLEYAASYAQRHNQLDLDAIKNAYKAFFFRAQHYAKQGESQKAIADYSNVITSAADQLNNTYDLCQLSHESRGAEFEKLNQSQEAAEDFLACGYYASMQGQSKESITYYTRALALNPQLIDAYHCRAL